VGVGENAQKPGQAHPDMELLPVDHKQGRLDLAGIAVADG
jgi:hypothetical protein